MEPAFPRCRASNLPGETGALAGVGYAPYT